MTKDAMKSIEELFNNKFITKKSIIFTGDGVSRGICIGQAIVVYKDNIDHAPSFIVENPG
ncbi:MAG: hypothetical protein CM15mP53_09690 [Ectothiorhodospiraceae bacterium]|nr:MAG: hypothetical protein CM15mP53_09690 [Ectothiorhodospiraceae bacterium]